MSQKATKNKLRILCLHGYRQNAELFRQKTGSFRKLLKSNAELVYITAPHEVLPLTEGGDVTSGDAIGQRGWWFSHPDRVFESKKHSDVCVGFEESLQAIKAAWEEKGPFDGLLGFSQGASFVSILCGLQCQKVLQLQFKFAIIVAGFKSMCSPHNTFYESVISIPSLHMYGESDQIIPKEMSEELAQLFQDPVLVTHPGGHYVPGSSSQKKILGDFLDSSCCTSLNNCDQTGCSNETRDVICNK